MISFDAMVKGRDKQFPGEWTQEIADNVAKTRAVVSEFFLAIGWDGDTIVTSGWRPRSINAAAGGAKNSAHLRGLAVDILDPDGVLYQLCTKYPELMKKFGVWIENYAYTNKKNGRWLHIDTVKRPERDLHIFIP